MSVVQILLNPFVKLLINREAEASVAGQTAQKHYYDETLKGFGVRVTSGGTKSFFVEKLVHRKLRHQEAAILKWNQIDLIAKTLTIVDTKNHLPHILPLSDFLYDLLKKRKLTAKSEYVFPCSGKGGYLVEPRKQMQKIIESSGITFI